MFFHRPKTQEEKRAERAEEVKHYARSLVADRILDEYFKLKIHLPKIQIQRNKRFHGEADELPNIPTDELNETYTRALERWNDPINQALYKYALETPPFDWDSRLDILIKPEDYNEAEKKLNR